MNDATGSWRGLLAPSHLGILVLALVLRGGWGLAVPVVPMSDSQVYDNGARSLALGLGFAVDVGGPLSAFWPVGTSFLYSIPYRLFGFHYGPIVVLNAVLGTLSVALVMLLARRWFDEQVALLAGALLALWPSQIEFTTVLASETPYIAFTLLALWLWSEERIGWGARSVGVGILLAACAYIRTTATLLPLLFGLFRVCRGGRFGSTTLAVGAILGFIAVLVAPWTYRNYRVLGEPVAIATNSGANLWMGNNPQTTGEYMDEPPMPGMNEVERDRHMKGLALEYIRQHPGRFLLRTGLKLLRLHERESIGVNWNEAGLAQRFPPTVVSSEGQESVRPHRVVMLLKLGSNAYWWAMLALGLAGIILLSRTIGIGRAVLHPAVLWWAYYGALHAITVIQDRYHFPSIPMIAILAALTVHWGLARLGIGPPNQYPASG